jgi:hypothetical protein
VIDTVTTAVKFGGPDPKSKKALPLPKIDHAAWHARCSAVRVAMLREVRIVQREGEPRRRWFTARKLELIVWIAADSTVDGFQLCYSRPGSEYGLTWTREGGYRHDRVDDGERNPTKNRSAVLIASRAFDAAELVRRFHESSGHIDPEIRQLVDEKLRIAEASLAAARARSVEQQTQSARM